MTLTEVTKFVTDNFLEFMRENGDSSNDVIVKSDQENAFTGHLSGLIGDLVSKRGNAKTFVEEAAKGKDGDI